MILHLFAVLFLLVREKNKIKLGLLLPTNNKKFFTNPLLEGK
jgi:hypothetical protein